MIHAYDKVYLEKARMCLGRMLDFAVCELGYALRDFYRLFLSSGYSQRFEQGDFTVLAGMSGVELAYSVLESHRPDTARLTPHYAANRSPEYWTGWALAYYQWETGLSFDEIERHIPIDDVCALYSPYHEMDIRQFVDRMNALYKVSRPGTNLKQRRQQAGLSQSDLAELSGIPLRSIQQYEQGQKNINHAKAETLSVFAGTLNCSMDDLLEHID